ncbi:hypothetical protein RR46_03790, partial [Papilio xuthus]
ILFAVKFVRTASGKQICILDGFTFYCNIRNNKSDTWRCTRWSHCRARVIVRKNGQVANAQLNHCHEPPSFIILMLVKKKNGKQLAVFNGYTFYVNYILKGTIYWRCPFTRTCKSRFITDNDLNILRGNYTHTHNAPRFVILQWAKTLRGTNVLIINGHVLNCSKYFGDTVYWRCKQNRSCKANATSKLGWVIRYTDEHNHPPRGYVLKNGVLKWAKNLRGSDVLIINGHVLNFSANFGKHMYWRCKQNKTCKGKATSNLGRVIRYTDEHNHPPRRYYISDVKLVNRKNGKQMAILNGYTFYMEYKRKDKICWRCTSTRACKSRFISDHDLNLIRGNYTHAHDPPRFVIRNGLRNQYIVVRTAAASRQSCAYACLQSQGSRLTKGTGELRRARSRAECRDGGGARTVREVA